MEALGYSGYLRRSTSPHLNQVPLHSPVTPSRRISSSYVMPSWVQFPRYLRAHFGVVGLPAFSHFTVSTSSRCSGESRIQVPLRPSASLLLSSLARYTPRKPARCTVTSRHVSSPQFTYLIWWAVTSVSCLSPLQLSPLGLSLLVNLSRSPSHHVTLHRHVHHVVAVPLP